MSRKIPFAATYTLFGVLSLVLTGFSVAPVRAQCQYEVTIIQGPTHPVYGLPATIPTGLNNLGHVVGYYFYIGEDERGFLWTPEGGFQTLPMPPGATAFRPRAINDLDSIVGMAEVPAMGGMTAFVYDDGTYTYLPPMPGGAWSEALDVNNLGQVVGYRSVGEPGDPVNPFMAFVWQAGAFTDLGLMDSTQTVARAINDAGQVVGYRGYSLATDEAFLWDQGEVTFLGALPGCSTSAASGINSARQVIGVGLETPTKTRIAFWEEGGWTLLPRLPDSQNGGVVDIDDDFQIVGSCVTPDGQLATVWREGQPSALVDLVNDPDVISLRRARGLNNVGQILVDGESRFGSPSAFLLNPGAIAGDLDGDGNVDLSDLARMLTAFGCTATCVGDVDGDGDADLSDLTIVLSNFGRTCS